MEPLDESLQDLKRLLKQTGIKLQKGTKLQDKYEIQGILGKGGMGCVYHAKDLHSDKEFAIKEIWISSQDQDHVQERVTREYYFLAALEHANLVKVYDFFQEQNQLFLVMEFVNGISLKTLIQNSPRSLSLLDQLAIANQIARAVEVLHAAQIIHRDIKPDNILINVKSKHIKLIDLGFARSVQGELSPITQAHAIVGTPGYISPEMLNGKVSVKSDIFSLGVTLYQFFLWLENSPFQSGNNISTIVKAESKNLPPLVGQIKWTLSLQEKQAYAELSMLLEQALEKDPEKRILDAELLADKMEQIYHNLRKNSQNRAKQDEDSKGWLLATRIDEPQRQALAALTSKYRTIDIEYPKRFTSIKWLVAIFVVLFCVVYTAMYWQNSPSEKSQGNTEQSTEQLPSFYPHINWQWDLAGEITSPLTLSDNVLYVGVRDGYLYSYDSKLRQINWQFTTHGRISAKPVVYDDTVYIGSHDSYVYAVDKNHGMLKWKYKTDHLVLVAVAVDQSRVYISGSQNVYALNKQDGALLWKLNTENSWSSTPFIHQGNVYFSNNFGAVYAVSAQEGQVLWKFYPNSGAIYRPVVAQDNMYFAGKESVYCLNLQNRQPIWQVNADLEVYSAPQMLDDMIYFHGYREIYAVHRNGQLYWNFSAPNESRILAAPSINHNEICVPYENELLILDTRSGKLKWRWHIEGVFSSPIITENEIYFAAQGIVYNITW